MRYSYYPGCSLKTTGYQYESSTKAVMARLGCELEELEDWSCCGSMASDMVSPLLSAALAARNLALADAKGQELVTTCSGCFLNLFRLHKRLERDRDLARKLHRVLAEVGLRYTGAANVRHLLEVIASDIGVASVRRQVTRPLEGLKVVPYYGCLVVRPYAEFDGPDLPMSMDRLIEAVGAEAVPFMMKTRCCGGTLITTKKSVGLKLISDILRPAVGADCIVTVCPLCQLNLDAYQAIAAREIGVRLEIPVLYVTQLMGIAFGLPEEDVKLSQNIVSPERMLSRFSRQALAMV